MLPAATVAFGGASARATARLWVTVKLLLGLWIVPEMARMGWFTRATVMLTVWEARTPLTKEPLVVGCNDPVMSESVTVPLNQVATLLKASYAVMAIVKSTPATWSAMGPKTKWWTAPAVKVTRAVSERVPTVAVTSATPGSVEVSCAVAWPFVVVQPEAGIRLPSEVVKATDVPFSTGLPQASCASAVNVEGVPTGKVSGAAVRVTTLAAPGITSTEEVSWLSLGSNSVTAVVAVAVLTTVRVIGPQPIVGAWAVRVMAAHSPCARFAAHTVPESHVAPTASE